MKTSNFVLSILGFFFFYICNADWMDRLYEKLIEDYIGSDYEEVAPFISSVTAGTEEFDRIIEELARSKRKWYKSSFLLSISIIVLTFSMLLYRMGAVLTKRRGIIKASREFLSRLCQSQNSVRKNKEEIQNLMMEFLENKFKQAAGGGGKESGDEEIPVELLWKGGTLVESSIHCNIKNEPADSSKIVHMQKRLLQSKLLVKCGDAGGGDEKSQVSPVPSDESTALKMAEIRKLLESEPEIIRVFVKEEAGPERRETSVSSENQTPSASSASLRRIRFGRSARSSGIAGEEKEESERGGEDGSESAVIPPFDEGIARTDRPNGEFERGRRKNSAGEEFPDPKLMNRIRLLESRLRLEELKNKNWINRMSRAEGILQQLNKQVERIEETRPMETRTQTLKITSTVTNWASSVSPRRNTQFTLVNQYQPFYLQAPCMSLSEIIKKEIGLPSFEEPSKPLYPIAPISPPIPVLTPPKKNPLSPILSNFLSR